MSTALVEAPELPGVGPACFGGFSFDTKNSRSHAWRDYPDALFILPRFAFASLPGERWVTTNVLVDGDADPDALEASIAREWDALNAAVNRSIAPSQSVSQEGTAPSRWLEMVGEALRLIERGELGKVVLARQLRVSAERPIDTQQVLGRLANAYPGCMLFAVGMGPATFLGATPELLVELTKGQVSATSLAGSAPRGATAKQDNLFARTLLREDKDLREHAYVVDAVRQALDGLCTGTTWDERPSVTKLETVQHLATTFRAIASPERHLLELAERLHPTPAVGGTPQHRAQQVIRKLEQADRGWYAGAVGRLDPSGDGELGVAIRSGFVAGNQALLYAGAGIVSGSDPQQEWAETELKLAPLLSALVGEV
jgi:isochorismate synthase